MCRFSGLGGIDHRCLGALFQLDNGRSVLVLAVHLTAYEDKISQREQEIRKIMEAVSMMAAFETDSSGDGDGKWKELLTDTISNNDIILCGDLNLHAPCETKIVYDSGFIDTWLHTRPPPNHNTHTSTSIEEGDNDFTWDPNRNALINAMLLFDNRRMRLDRVLLKRNTKSLKCNKVEIFGDIPIFIRIILLILQKKKKQCRIIYIRVIILV